MKEYTPEFERQVQAWAEERIKNKRLDHVRGVVELGSQLADRYAPEHRMRVRLAGWIHDAAKALSDDELLAIAIEKGLAITEDERNSPMLLHGAVGYALADEQFSLDDPLIQSACTNHTTGAPVMAITDKIVFLADLLEPGRDFPEVDRLRAALWVDLDVALLMSLDHTLQYFLDRGKTIDPRPLLLRNRLIEAGVSYQR
jgi:predicted HD superfamily hydrolase involved in NAD metabolism